MKTTAVRFLTLILCALAAIYAVAQDTKLKPGAIKGETLTFMATQVALIPEKSSQAEEAAHGARSRKTLVAAWAAAVYAAVVVSGDEEHRARPGQGGRAGHHSFDGHGAHQQNYAEARCTTSCTTVESWRMEANC